MQNINSQKCTFIRFITALNEYIQARLKVKMMWSELEIGGANGSFNTHVGQWARITRHFRRDKGPKAKVQTRHNFEEARRINLCFTFHRNWLRGHRFTPGSMRYIILERINSLKQAVYFAQCLLDLLSKTINVSKWLKNGWFLRIVWLLSWNGPTSVQCDQIEKEDYRDGFISTEHIESVKNLGLNIG